MAHPNINERREYIKHLLESGQELDYQSLMGRYNCSRSAIYADVRIMTASGDFDCVYIYTLSDETGVRYIGISNLPNLRYSSHLRDVDSVKSTLKIRWLQDLAKQGLTPTLEVIDKCSGYPEAYTKEQDWILYYRKRGCKLVNGKR